MAPVRAKAARSSPSGMAEARTAVRVRTTDCAISGSVSSSPRLAAAAAKAGTPGVMVQGMPEGVEAAALLGDGAVERRVAGVDAGHVLVPGGRFVDHGNDLVEVHRRGIADEGVGGGFGHHLAGDEGAGVEADRAAADQGQPADGDEVGRSRARTDEVDGHATR